MDKDKKNIKIDVNFFTFNNKKNFYLQNYFQSNKKFNFKFLQFEELKQFKTGNNLFVFSKKFDHKYFNKIKDHNLKNACFFLFSGYQKKIIEKNINCIFYPIKMSFFEEKLKAYFYKNVIYFNDLQLLNDNLLIQKNENNEIYLTEIESKIIKILFTKKKINKITINKDILNQKPSVDSKSLESHLYRLRKKIANLDKSIQIIIGEDQNIYIK